MNKTKKFFNDIYFYKFPKETKDKIRNKIVNEDHKSYGIALSAVCLLQIVMLLISFVRYGFENPDKPWVFNYRLFYILLIVSCILAFALIELAYNKKERYALFYCCKYDDGNCRNLGYWN